MFNWLKKTFTILSFNKKEIYSFKVANISGYPEKKDVLISYQVRGKSIVINEKPGKLVDELMILKGFSKEDSEIIYGLAIAEKKSADYRVSHITFCESGSSILFEDVKLNITFAIKTKDIFHEKDLLRKLDSHTTEVILALYHTECFITQNDILKIKNKQIDVKKLLRIIK